MKEKKEENYFIELNNIDVSKKIEKKNGLNYLSWAWAWAELKKIHPKANYKIYEQENGCIYWTDGKTCWVKTGVIIDDIEHIEYLPIMDYRNKSILLEDITSFNVNSAIQRSLTKAVARHGLGLYIYAGEDLPNDTKDADTDEYTKRTKEEPTNDKEDMEMMIQEGQKQIISKLKPEALKKLLDEKYKVESINDLTWNQAREIETMINNKLNKEGKKKEEVF